jgi:hypothetical protein
MTVAAAIALVFFAGPGVDPSAAAATQAAVKERLARGGAELIDLSAEHRTLFTRSPFVDFTAPPPASVPPEVAASWKKGSEACAQRAGVMGPGVGEHTRASNAAHAFRCREALAGAIWDLLLEAHQVTRVVEVELRAPRADGSVTVFASLLEPASTAASPLKPGSPRVFRGLEVKNASAERAAADAGKAVADLLGGGGDDLTPLDYLLPSLGVPALDAVPLGPGRTAVVPAACKGGLPARLEVFPLGKLTHAIEASYKTVPANVRTGKPLRCDLVLWPDDHTNAGPPSASARLWCPPAQARAVEAVSNAPVLVAKLVDGVVESLCQPAETQ